MSAVPASVNLVIMAPHYDKGFGDWVSNPEAITCTRSWEETPGLLVKRFGPGTRVAVLSDATMQHYV